MTSRTVLVVSRDMLLGDALRGVLVRSGWSTTGVVGDGIHALAHVTRDPPDRVLLLGTPARLGIDAFARQLARLAEPPDVVALAVDDDAPVGALPRTATLDEVIRALDAPPRLVLSEAPPRTGIDRLATLTARERTVLGLLANGRSRSEIAGELGLSPNTVRTHVQHVYEKLRLHSAADLVRFASRHGLGGDGAGRQARRR